MTIGYDQLCYFTRYLFATSPGDDHFTFDICHRIIDWWVQHHIFWINAQHSHPVTKMLSTKIAIHTSDLICARCHTYLNIRLLSQNHCHLPHHSWNAVISCIMPTMLYDWVTWKMMKDIDTLSLFFWFFCINSKPCWSFICLTQYLLKSSIKNRPHICWCVTGADLMLLCNNIS